MGHRILALVSGMLLIAAACSATSAEPNTSSPSTTLPPVETTAPPSTATTQPPTTTALPPPPLPTASLEARPIWLFPGPDHFEGDVLSAQVPLADFDDHELGPATVTIDGDVIATEVFLSSDPLLGGYLTITDVFDTAAAVGEHTIEVTAEIDGEPFAVAIDFVVHPASDRPEQEWEAAWTAFETDCCLVHYLEGSAAERDLAEVRAIIDTSAAEVESVFATDIPQMEIVLLDVLWGNGGYAGGELVISYLDRDFGPTTASTVAMTFVHEITHGAARTLDGDAPWPLDEAIAVFVAGGHFKPEDVPARAAALMESGALLPLEEFLDDFPTLQHEQRYVQAGALAAYLVDTYGWDGFLDLYTAEHRTSRVSGWFDQAAEDALEVAIDDVDAGFRAWLGTIDPEPERRDLELSVMLQQTRRHYQAMYAPYQNFFVYDSVLEAGSTAVALREARSPELVAAEALIAWAQRLIVDGRLDLAEQAIGEIAGIVETGRIESPLASQVLAVSLALDTTGYEMLSIELDGTTAAVTATRAHPVVEHFVADLDGGAVTLVGPMAEAS